MKDNFSTQSGIYAKYRPSYPDVFFQFIKTITTGTDNAWDCGTGNGQVAGKLAEIFDHVYATDISDKQLEYAVKKPNLHYSVQQAEKTGFPPDLFDLITVAQAIHWFDFDKFYAEVVRIAKINSRLIVTGYSRPTIDKSVDAVIDHFYTEIIGPYWDKERKYVDENYRTIPFPFEEIPTPSISNRFEWNLEQFSGYLETWSSVQHYQKKNNKNPLDLIATELKNCWGKSEKKLVDFPLLLRVGKIKK